MTSRMNRGVLFAASEASSSSTSSTASSSSSFSVPTVDFGNPPRSAPLDAEDLRKRARELERKLDLSIDNISENEDVEYAYKRLKESEDLLLQLQDVNRQISSSGVSSSQIQHHLEKQRQFSQQLQRFKTRLDEKRARAALFSPTQDTGTGGDDISVNMKTLMADRESLLNSNRTASDVISQGLAVRETLQRGRVALENNLARLQGTVGRFDSIDSVMTAIKRAKVKNTVILATVIGLCICFLIWFAIR